MIDARAEAALALSRLRSRAIRPGELVSMEAATLDVVLHEFLLQGEALESLEERLKKSRERLSETEDEVDRWAKDRERMHRRAQRAEGKVLRMAAVAEQATTGGLRSTEFVDRGMTAYFGRQVAKESER